MLDATFLIAFVAAGVVALILFRRYALAHDRDYCDFCGAPLPEQIYSTFGDDAFCSHQCAIAAGESGVAWNAHARRS
jgi:hypothetical protein